MTRQEERLRRNILSIVGRDEHTGVTLTTQLRTLDPNVFEGAARRMILRLIDRGEVSLSINRRLVLGPFNPELVV